MKLTKDCGVSPFKNSIVERPWGHYGLYADNEVCTSKILYVKQNEMLSMQYHFKRDQYYLILDDGFIVDYSEIPVPEELLYDDDEERRIKGFENFLIANLITTAANEGDEFGFHRRVIHRVKYIGLQERGRILDMAFGENDENDIVRIKDKYGRNN